MFPQVPLMSYDQMIEEQARTLEQWPRAEDQLPAYSEATKDKSPVKVTEKEIARKQQPESAKGSGRRMSTLKSILTGDVHKYNAHYVVERANALERSTNGKLSEAPEPATRTAKASSGTVSTLKSILTGEVHKYNAHSVVERANALETEAREAKKSSAARSGSSSSSSTFKSILTGAVQSHHPMYRLEESVDPRARRER
ncbi:hypothetical protein LTR36_003971 [Oleoguttula mirabilis]|uniref:Uncharacterized protein n=1 Tax=Oleoguttula mirabilis TaxID=1507867 RepID=A0AAV9JHC2_9PEZI|nr:hypothetical protein LTR36_003971 [Oleoguttula mirabilis]